jgi:hypothetical protein
MVSTSCLNFMNSFSQDAFKQKWGCFINSLWDRNPKVHHC